MTTKCPKCGQTVASTEHYLLTPTEHDILRVIRENRSSILSPVETQIIADALRYAPRTMRLYLARLEKHGYVTRRLGPRKGWIEGDVYNEIAEIIAEMSKHK